MPPLQTGAPHGRATMLNSACCCLGLDEGASAHALDCELGQPDLSALVRQRASFLFAAVPVSVAAAQLQRMARVMQAVESVAGLPASREQAQAQAQAHPQEQALCADKWHLALSSDAADAQRLWDARRGLFFKPTAGFGSCAVYRGHKLTKRVWQDILAGDDVAQAIVAQGERRADANDTEPIVKAGKAEEFEFSDLIAQRFKTRHHKHLIPYNGGLARLPEAVA